MRRQSKPTKSPRLADLDGYRRQGGRMCGVCASPYRQFIEQAITAGHSKRAVVEYLTTEFDAKLPYIGRHLQNHVKAT